MLMKLITTPSHPSQHKFSTQQGALGWATKMIRTKQVNQGGTSGVVRGRSGFGDIGIGSDNTGGSRSTINFMVKVLNCDFT